MSPAERPSPTWSYGPFSVTTNRSTAVMRPSLSKPTFTRECSAGTRAADVVLVLAGDAHHHRRVRLLREQRRDRHRDVARDPAAEAAAGVLADEHDVFRLDADPARDARHGLHRALRAGVQEQLAVLPVGHRRARLEHLVAGVRVPTHVSIEHERGVLEAGLDDRRTTTRRCALPIGIWPAGAAAKSASVHFSS